jgi:hypothetical protein
VLTLKRLIAEKKHAIQSAHADGFEKADVVGKDLLSILSTSFHASSGLIKANDVVKANMATDLRADQRLTDDEVLAQITTFVRLDHISVQAGKTDDRCWQGMRHLLRLSPGRFMLLPSTPNRRTSSEKSSWRWMMSDHRCTRPFLRVGDIMVRQS